MIVKVKRSFGLEFLCEAQLIGVTSYFVSRDVGCIACMVNDTTPVVFSKNLYNNKYNLGALSNFQILSAHIENIFEYSTHVMV